MSQFNLSDIQSSTLLMSSDSFDDVLVVVNSIVDADGVQGLGGLTLSISNPDDANDYDEAEADAILHLLERYRVQTHRTIGIQVSPWS